MEKPQKPDRKDTIACSIRMPRTVIEALDALAEANLRTRNSEILRAIKNHLQQETNP